METKASKIRNVMDVRERARRRLPKISKIRSTPAWLAAESP